MPSCAPHWPDFPSTPAPHLLPQSSTAPSVFFPLACSSCFTTRRPHLCFSSSLHLYLDILVCIWIKSLVLSLLSHLWCFPPMVQLCLSVPAVILNKTSPCLPSLLQRGKSRSTAGNSQQNMLHYVSWSNIIFRIMSVQWVLWSVLMYVTLVKRRLCGATLSSWIHIYSHIFNNYLFAEVSSLFTCLRFTLGKFFLIWIKSLRTEIYGIWERGTSGTPKIKQQ